MKEKRRRGGKVDEDGKSGRRLKCENCWCFIFIFFFPWRFPCSSSFLLTGWIDGCHFIEIGEQGFIEVTQEQRLKTRRDEEDDVDDGKIRIRY